MRQGSGRDDYSASADLAIYGTALCRVGMHFESWCGKLDWKQTQRSDMLFAGHC